MQIAGSTAFVTGASSGIGRATAIDLARRGARIGLCARRTAALEETRDACRRAGVEAHAWTCDLRDRDALAATFAAAAEQLGPIDLLVNNAGASAYHLFAEAPAAEFEEMLAANYLPAVFATRAVLPAMLARGHGAIVFVSSFAGRVATYRHTAYSASKFAVTGLAEALYYEVRGRGVHVAVVQPGAVRTELFERGAEYGRIRHVVEPKMVAPEVVARAIARAVERERFEVFAPARYGWVWTLRALLPRLVERGTLAFVERRMARPPGAG